MRDDGRLVQRIQNGERGAFEMLVDLYGPRIHRLVRRYVDNPSDAEDVTQEIFIDVARGIRTFRGDSQVMTWVYRIAVNHCLRHRQRCRPDSVPFDDALDAVTDWRCDPHRHAVQSELCGVVHSALGGLSEQHRDVVVLHELHGLTYQECSALLEVPVGTVKSRLSNAFRRLRVTLRGCVAGEEVGTHPAVDRALS